MTLQAAARTRVAAIAATAWLITLAAFAASAPAASPVDLGRASPFAVLGATTVTSAGESTITGDIGVSPPGVSVTGFPPGTIIGAMHAGDAVAAAAHEDLALAYDAAVLVPKTADAAVLDGLTLAPGVHRAGAALSLAGTLTLDGGGDPNAVFIFQAGSTLTTAAGSLVSLTGAAQACNVFWQVGSSATLGAGSLLRGSILAHTAISAGAGVTVHGRALAVDGAVTLDNDTVSTPGCATDPAVTLEPVFGDFSATTLNGAAQSTHTTISDWSVSDPRSGTSGWQVTMSASPLVTAGLTPVTMTGATLTLTAPEATPVDPANASTAPAVLGGNLRAGVTVAAAGPGAGLRSWRLAQGATDLTLGIPADARAGSYTSTITTTLSPAP